MSGSFRFEISEDRKRVECVDTGPSGGHADDAIVFVLDRGAWVVTFDDDAATYVDIDGRLININAGADATDKFIDFFVRDGKGNAQWTGGRVPPGVPAVLVDLINLACKEHSETYCHIGHNDDVDAELLQRHHFVTTWPDRACEWGYRVLTRPLKFSDMVKDMRLDVRCARCFEPVPVNADFAKLGVVFMRRRTETGECARPFLHYFMCSRCSDHSMTYIVKKRKCTDDDDD